MTAIHHKGHFIGGGYTAAEGSERLDVHSPWSEEIVGSVPRATMVDIDHAAAAAKAALLSPTWAESTPSQRSRVLTRMADYLRTNEQSIADVVTEENGCPVKYSRDSQVRTAIAVFDYYAELVTSRAFEEERHGWMGTSAVRQVPVGVVAAITPWNYPLYLAATKLAPAIAAGATVVLKPAPETPLSSYAFAEAAMAADLPPGVLNVVAAAGAESGYLAGHADVDKVAFTGSTETGSVIARTCSDRVARVSLELGGKSAAILLDDVDIDRQMPAVVHSGLRNSGQICIAQSRILAPRSRYEEIVAAAAACADALVLGDPHDPATDLGPVVSSRQRARVESYVETARAEGADIVTGGRRPPTSSGWFVEPTVIANVTPRMTVFLEEIFGPVVTVTPYDDINQAVELANATRFGLAASVWGDDMDTAGVVARRLRTGTVGLNTIRLDPAIPFGGMKQSGFGRELGPEGLDGYLETQTIHYPEPPLALVPNLLEGPQR